MSQAAFAPDGERILTTSRDGTARIFDLEGRSQLVLRVGDVPLTCGAWESDGAHVLLGTANGLIHRRPVDTPHVLKLARRRASK